MSEEAIIDHERTRREELAKQVVELMEQGVRQHGEGKTGEAAESFTRALALAPNHPVALTNLGAALRALGRPHAAVACYRRSLAIDPGQAGALSNLGNVLRDLGQFEESLACHARSVSLDPEAPLSHHNLGLVLSDMGQCAAATAEFDRALRLLGKPSAQIAFDASLALLKAGRLREGFQLYEARMGLPDWLPRYQGKPLWNGQPLAEGQTLVIHSEQGFGDAIQFARFVPRAAEAAGQAGTVIFECQPELLPLLGALPGPNRVVGRGERELECDVRLPLLSLPRLIGLDGGELGNPLPYLAPPPEAGFPLRTPPGTRLKVGLVWRCKHDAGRHARRNIPLPELLALAGAPGVTLYSLYKGPYERELELAANPILVRNLAPALTDFGQTAAVVRQLDLVVTCDTAMAHLAGALGAPVWVLLPNPSDWRYQLARTDSPWYPSMRLFRQEKPGEWRPLVEQVARELSLLAAASGRPQ